MLTVRLRDTQLRLGFGFFAALALLLVLDGGRQVLPMLLACAVHECGHLLAAFWLGMPVRSVTLSLFGIHMEGETGGISHLRRAAISLMGPLANFLFFLLLAPFAPKSFCAMQLILFLFHILPAVPLDGGEALYSALCAALSARAARRVTLITTFILTVVIGALGFSILLRTRYNFTLLLVALYIMLYLVLKRRENFG